MPGPGLPKSSSLFLAKITLSKPLPRPEFPGLWDWPLQSAVTYFHRQNTNAPSAAVLHSLEVCSSFTDMHATPWCTYGFRARSLATVLLLQLPKYWLRPGIKDPLTSAAKHQSFSFPSGLTYRIRLDVHNMSKLIDIRFRRSTYRRLLGRIF